MRVPCFPAYLDLDPVVSTIHWVGCPLGWDLAEMVAVGLAVLGFGQSSTKWVERHRSALSWDIHGRSSIKGEGGWGA